MPLKSGTEYGRLDVADDHLNVMLLVTVGRAGSSVDAPMVGAVAAVTAAASRYRAGPGGQRNRPWCVT